MYPAEPIVVDGDLQEWSAAPWTEDFVDITGDLSLKPDLLTRAKMLWDSNFLYIAAELEEPHLWATVSKRDEVIYVDNDFEVFIDPDGDTHNYAEIEVNAMGTVWDLFLTRDGREGRRTHRATCLLACISGQKSASERDLAERRGGTTHAGIWATGARQLALDRVGRSG